MTILSKDPDRIDDETLRLIALSIHLEVSCNELEPSYHDARCIEWGNEEWLVLTDDEADALTRLYVENYIDDLILPNLFQEAREGFDHQSFIADRIDEGRGIQLAGYDGVEHEIYIKATNEWLYLYRTQ